MEKSEYIGFESSGLKCVMANRHPLGFWCGYVGVSKGHPLYQKSFIDDEDTWELEVHGGLTYSSSGVPGMEADPDMWWFGFDCAHGGDLVPGYSLINLEFDFEFGPSVYRDREYVKSECESLALQLNEMVGG